MGQINDLREWWHQKKRNLKPRIRELKYSLKEFKKSRVSLVGLFLIVFFIILAIFGPAIAPHDPNNKYQAETHLPAFWAEDGTMKYPFGTDRMGAPILSRILYSIRLDLALALIVVGAAVSIGTIIGGVAGYFGGIVDEALMRFTEVFMSFPGIILAMAVTMIFAVSGIDIIMYSLIVVWWPPYCRLIRGNILSEKEKLYVEAARAIGLSRSKILFKHVLPNVFSSVIILATMDLGSVLLVAAGLAFIGIGPEPGAAELGLMISEGRQWLMTQPGYVFFPGFTILLIVLGFNLLGDGLRDIFNPRIRR